jgi:hypothetical protein
MTSTADFRKAALSFYLGARLQSNAKARSGQPKIFGESSEIEQIVLTRGQLADYVLMLFRESPKPGRKTMKT